MLLSRQIKLYALSLTARLWVFLASKVYAITKPSGRAAQLLQAAFERVFSLLLCRQCSCSLMLSMQSCYRLQHANGSSHCRHLCQSCFVCKQLCDAMASQCHHAMICHGFAVELVRSRHNASCVLKGARLGPLPECFAARQRLKYVTSLLLKVTSCRQHYYNTCASKKVTYDITQVTYDMS